MSTSSGSGHSTPAQKSSPNLSQRGTGGMASTSSGNAATTSSSVPRKSSAERSIEHTRMEDEAVHTEYTFGDIIGEGSFGKVYKATNIHSGHTVAIKEIVKEKAGSSGIRQLEKEVSIFKKVNHSNIIKLKEVIESPKKMYLIMELCEGGDLARLLQKRGHLSEKDTKCVMSKLAAAIKYLHQLGIIHRDLKLENILLADDPDKGEIQIKVTDFGLSTQQNNNSYENMQEQYCGTPSYMAPEMNSTYSYPVDVWAMGIIMYYLLTRYPKDNELNESIARDGPQFKEPQWESVSLQAKQLLREMLHINPAYRTSSGEVLNHEWFTGKKREHGNVLELMKDFGREQKESDLNLKAQGDGSASSAINGETETAAVSASCSVKVTVKEPRKGSGGKKTSSGDNRNRTPPSSGLLKPNVKNKNLALMTSPRTSKTPTPKSSETSSGSRSSLASTKTSVASSNISKQQSTINGPSSKASTTTSRAPPKQPVKKK